MRPSEDSPPHPPGESCMSDGEHLAELGLATVRDGVSVKDSEVDESLEAGRGLFAERFFKKGSAVTVYRGKILTKEEAANERIQTHILRVARMQVRGKSCDEIGDDIYVLGDRRVLNGRGGGQFSNHPPAGTKPNVEPTIMEGSVVLMALDDISPGQEIFIKCGTAEARDMMMGWTRMELENIEGKLVVRARPAHQACPQSDECGLPWSEWSTCKLSGGWRIGEDMGRKADLLLEAVWDAMGERGVGPWIREMVAAWPSTAMSEAGRSMSPTSLAPKTRPIALTAKRAFLSDPPPQGKIPRGGVWRVANLLQGEGDDAVYPKGRMQDVLEDKRLTVEERLKAAVKLLHREVLPTGMASDRGHWCRASTGQLLDARKRRAAMGWKRHLSTLSQAQAAVEISDEHACALEMQAVHGAPADALASLTEWLLRYHPTRKEWLGAEGSFALLGAGAGLWGLSTVDAIETEGLEPSYVLFAECMDNAVAYHDAIYTSLGLNPVRFKWAHGAGVLSSGRRARRVLLSLCCGWISRASPMQDADVMAALNMHAGALLNIWEGLVPDVIWVETSAAIMHKDREQERDALESIILRDPRWEWRRFRLNPRTHFAFPVERDRVFYGGLRTEAAAWPSDDVLKEHMDHEGGMFERFAMRKPLNKLGQQREDRKRAPSTRTAEGPSASELDRRQARLALAAQQNWEVFAFHDPEANLTAPPWTHDRSGALSSSRDHSVSLPTLGDVAVAPTSAAACDSQRASPQLLSGPRLALAEEEESELTQEAFHARYGARLADEEERKSRGGLVPKGDPRGAEDEALLERMSRRGQGHVDRWRYPLREETGRASHVDQLATLMDAMNDKRGGRSKEESVRVAVRRLKDLLRRRPRGRPEGPSQA